jgi:hypothetical protein
MEAMAAHLEYDKRARRATSPLKRFLMELFPEIY